MWVIEKKNQMIDKMYLLLTIVCQVQFERFVLQQ